MAIMLDSPPMTGRRVHLETFGCQMNELDSELVRSQLSRWDMSSPMTAPRRMW